MAAGIEEGEVSSHDHVGNADDPRNGQLGPSEANAREVPEASSGYADAPQGGYGHPEQREIEEALIAKIEEMGPDEFVSMLLGVRSTSWSGLLPPPESFNQYPDYVQRQMVAWNDAQIIGSASMDGELADAEIKQLSRGQWLSFFLNLVFAMLSFAAFIATGNVVSFGFLAIPGISVAFNIWKSGKSDSDSKSLEE